jgi:hypothetical protein
MRRVEEHTFHLPHVSCREAPIVRSEGTEIDNRVAFHPSRKVDVRVDVAECERTCRGEHGLTSMKSRVARPGDGSPTTVSPIHEQHMIELVDGFKAQDERWKAMLFENRGGRVCRLQTVGCVMTYDAAETPERGAAGRRFGVVRQVVQKVLNELRSLETMD